MRDTLGLVPDYIRVNNELDETVERNARQAKALDAALKQHDPKLAVVYVKSGAPGHYGTKPGYWHVRRHNDPPAADTYIPIQTPEGGFREPDSGVLFELQMQDLWRRPELVPKAVRKERSGHVYHEIEEDPAIERERKRADEQRRDEIRSDFEAAKRVAGEGGLTKRKWGRG